MELAITILGIAGLIGAANIVSGYAYQAYVRIEYIYHTRIQRHWKERV